MRPYTTVDTSKPRNQGQYLSKCKMIREKLARNKDLADKKRTRAQKSMLNFFRFDDTLVFLWIMNKLQHGRMELSEWFNFCTGHI